MKINFHFDKRKCLLAAGMLLCIFLAFIIVQQCTGGNNISSAHDLMATDNSKAGQTYVLRVGQVGEFPIQGGTSHINIASYRIGKKIKLCDRPCHKEK